MKAKALNKTLKNIFLTGLLAGIAGHSSAKIILNDDFSDGTRFSTPSGADWYVFAGTGLDVSSEVLTLKDATGTKGVRGAEVHFMPQTLEVKGAITVRFSIRQDTIIESATAVRIGLLNSKGTALPRDTSGGILSDTYQTRTGYFCMLDTRTAGTGTVSVRYDDSSQNLFSIAEGNNVDVFSNLHKFNNREWTSVVWSIERVRETEYVLSMSVNDGRPKTMMHRIDEGGTFDTFMIFSRDGAEFSIDNVEIEFAGAYFQLYGLK